MFSFVLNINKLLDIHVLDEYPLISTVSVSSYHVCIVTVTTCGNAILMIYMEVLKQNLNMQVACF